MDSKVLEGSGKKAKSSGKEIVSKKRIEEEFDQESSKRKKTSDSSKLTKELSDKEADELVHHVSTKKGIDIYTLVEKEYPLSRGTLTLMLVAKLMVDQDNEVSRELLRLLSGVEVTAANMEVTTAGLRYNC
nr:hypothetical protein [Tanacetum cinerariifolium]